MYNHNSYFVPPDVTERCGYRNGQSLCPYTKVRNLSNTLLTSSAIPGYSQGDNKLKLRPHCFLCQPKPFNYGEHTPRVKLPIASSESMMQFLAATKIRLPQWMDTILDLVEERAPARMLWFGDCKLMGNLLACVSIMDYYGRLVLDVTVDHGSSYEEMKT